MERTGRMRLLLDVVGFLNMILGVPQIREKLAAWQPWFEWFTAEGWMYGLFVLGFSIILVAEWDQIRRKLRFARPKTSPPVEDRQDQEKTAEKKDEAYTFPDDLTVHIEERGPRPGPTWGLYLEVENPAGADEWDARIEEIHGARGPPPPGLHLRWKNMDPARQVCTVYDRAVLEFGIWDPMGEGWDAAGEDWRPGRFTLRATDRQTDYFMSPEGVRDLSELPYKGRLTFVFRLLSRTTGNTARYRVTISGRSQSDLSPDVDVMRID